MPCVCGRRGGSRTALGRRERAVDHGRKPVLRAQGATGCRRDTHVPAQNPASFSIDYSGGPIMNVGTSVYIVYYGTWPAISVQIINSFVANLGGTPLHNIQTTYYDAAGVHIPNTIKFNHRTNAYHDNYSLGKNLTDADVQTIISNAIAGGHLANDVNGVYFVLTAQDVNQTAFGGGLCTGDAGRGWNNRSVGVAALQVEGQSALWAIQRRDGASPTGISHQDVFEI